MNRLILASAFVLAAALPAAAQPLKMQLHDGRVTLEANGVPARVILAEWARLGGTRIVGGEKVTGGPLTLRLVDMPERQALDIILRNVAGFMAAPRLASSAPGASTYDRIMILATSSTPPTAAATAGRPTPGVAVTPNRRLPPRPPNLPPAPADDDPADNDQPVDDDQADTGVAQQPVFTFPSPGGANGQLFVPTPNGGRPGTPGAAVGQPPVITLQPNPNGQPTIYNFVPNPDGTAPPQPGPTSTPTFGTIGSSAPGVIQPPPAPATPGQPQRPPRQ